MFLLSALSVALWYVALFNLLERAVKSDMFVAHFGLGLVKQRPNVALFLFNVINHASSTIGFLVLSLFIIGAIPFEDILHHQYWMVGYLWYHIIVASLYPELGVGDQVLNMAWSLACYIYAFNTYSWVYTLALLSIFPETFKFWSVLLNSDYPAPPKALEGAYKRLPTISATQFRIFLTGTLLAYSALSVNTIPMLFFIGLMCTHTGILPF